MAEYSQKSFVVFGATGYTGRAVVEQLAAAQIPVLAHVRPDSQRIELIDSWQKKNSIEVARVPWDRGALAALATSRPNAIVISALGITRSGARAEARRTGSKAPTYQTVDRDLTLMAFEAFSQADRFVYLSAAGVDGGFRNDYVNARRDVEATLQASEAAWTVARPGFITGDDRDESRPAERFGAAMSNSVLSLLSPLTGGKLDKWRSMTGSQLATALIDLALDPNALRHIAEPEELRDRAERPTHHL